MGSLNYKMSQLSKSKLKILLLFIFIVFAILVSCEDKSIEPEPEGELILIYPNGGEKLTAGAIDSIKYNNSQEYDSLKFYYSLNNGSNWNFIGEKSDSISNEFHIWQVPWEVTETAKVRIVAYTNTNQHIIESETVFEIELTSFKLIYPNGDDKLTAGAIDTIKYNNSQEYDSLKFYYSLNNGFNWNFIGEKSDSISIGFHIWKVPYVAVKTAKVKIDVYAQNNQYSVESESVFEIEITAFKLIYPNGGEKLTAGTIDTIKYTLSQSVNSLKFYYSLDNGSNWNFIGEKSDSISNGFHIWQIPYVAVKTAKIKIDVYTQNYQYSVESESVFEIEVKRLKIIHPNGGEKLTGGELYTIQINNYIYYDSLSFFYSLDNGSDWFPMIMSENSDDLYIWLLPWENSTNVKIRILAYVQGKMYIFESESVFEITGSSSKIIEPSSSSMFTDPKSIRISWNTTIPFDRYELYYSKYSDEVIYYGNPDNKIVYSSDWILLDENIDGQLREYNWENPYLYSNKVQIKLVGFLENEQYEILSDVFTVHLGAILSEEREYQEKLSVNNKWVYKISSYFVGEEKNYYLVKDVINEFLEDGKNYYEIREKTTRDTISYKFLKVVDREHFEPTYILQNGDEFVIGWYSNFLGYWDMHQYRTNSVKFYNTNVLSSQMEVREYDYVDSGSGTFTQTTKRVKDIGIFSEKSNSDGHRVTKNLLGALIDGVVYGDTTVVK